MKNTFKQYISMVKYMFINGAIYPIDFIMKFKYFFCTFIFIFFIFNCKVIFEKQDLKGA